VHHNKKDLQIAFKFSKTVTVYKNIFTFMEKIKKAVEFICDK